MPTSVVIDTCIIIDHLRQAPNPDIETALFNLIGTDNIIPVISTITVQELYVGQSTREKDKEKLLRGTLEIFEIKDLTFDIAKKAGKIMRDAPKLLEFADAAIAATALTLNAHVFTRNTKDFECIDGLKLYNL